MGRGERGRAANEGQMLCIGYTQCAVAGFAIFLSCLIMLMAQSVLYHDTQDRDQCVDEVADNVDYDFPQCYSQEFYEEDESESMGERYYSKSPDTFTSGIVDYVTFAAMFSVTASIPVCIAAYGKIKRDDNIANACGGFGIFTTLCGSCLTWTFTILPLFTSWALTWACAGYDIHYQVMKDQNENNYTQCIDECLAVVKYRKNEWCRVAGASSAVGTLLYLLAFLIGGLSIFACVGLCCQRQPESNGGGTTTVIVQQALPPNMPSVPATGPPEGVPVAAQVVNPGNMDDNGVEFRYKARLSAFYVMYKPEKLANPNFITNTLLHYMGREEELFKELTEK